MAGGTGVPRHGELYLRKRAWQAARNKYPNCGVPVSLRFWGFRFPPINRRRRVRARVSDAEADRAVQGGENHQALGGQRYVLCSLTVCVFSPTCCTLSYCLRTLADARRLTFFVPNHKARRSWLLRTKRKTGTQQLPEHRAMMANIWYPAVDRGGGGNLGKDGGADGERNDGIDGESNDPINSSSPKSPKSPKQPPWPMDTDVTFAAMASSETNRGQSRPINPINAKTQRHIAKFEKRKRDALLSGKKRRAHWLDPLLASTLAESFFLPAWIVDYFRLVKMDALEDAVVAEPPSSPMGSGFGSSASTPIGSGSHEDPQTTSVGFPVVLFSHSFTGVKEQNSALLQELASWGHVVVAVDHPHDAALVLYPDGRYVLGLSQIPPPRLKDLKEAW